MSGTVDSTTWVAPELTMVRICAASCVTAVSRERRPARRARRLPEAAGLRGGHRATVANRAFLGPLYPGVRREAAAAEARLIRRHIRAANRQAVAKRNALKFPAARRRAA